MSHRQKYSSYLTMSLQLKIFLKFRITFNQDPWFISINTWFLMKKKKRDYSLMKKADSFSVVSHVGMSFFVRSLSTTLMRQCYFSILWFYFCSVMSVMFIGIAHQSKNPQHHFVRVSLFYIKLNWLRYIYMR